MSLAPDLHQLLADLRRFLRAVQHLFGRLPEGMRTRHLEGKVTALIGRIDEALRTLELAE